jgi:hypothetical protein
LDLGAGNLIDLRGFLQDLQDTKTNLVVTGKNRGLDAKPPTIFYLLLLLEGQGRPAVVV